LIFVSATSLVLVIGDMGGYHKLMSKQFWTLLCGDIDLCK